MLLQWRHICREIKAPIHSSFENYSRCFSYLLFQLLLRVFGWKSLRERAGREAAPNGTSRTTWICVRGREAHKRYPGWSFYMGGRGWSLAVIGGEKNKHVPCPWDLSGFGDGRLHASSSRWGSRGCWRCQAPLRPHTQLFVRLGKDHLSPRNEVRLLHVQLWNVHRAHYVRPLKRVKKPSPFHSRLFYWQLTIN